MRGIHNIVVYLFRKDRTFYFNLVSMLGFLPAKVSYYRVALTHKSASTLKDNGELVNNERLEYLGDAILDAIVAEYLFRKFPEYAEGSLTKLRSRIVKRKTMNSLAVKMGIPNMIISYTNPGNISKHLYGNALEALIGAIYLDRGYNRAMRFFTKKILQNHIDLSKLVRKDTDYKSQLIEWAQKTKNLILFESYEKRDNKGVLPSFVSIVTKDSEKFGTGTGSSKKEAEQRAAREALQTLDPNRNS